MIPLCVVLKGFMTTWYAVYHGKVPGVYATWAQCCEQVAGVHNKMYKAFKCREEAEASLNAYYEATQAPPFCYLLSPGQPKRALLAKMLLFAPL